MTKVFYFNINTRDLSYYTSLNEELTLHEGHNYLYDLTYLAGLHVGGENAATFLQGQFSCNVEEITPYQMRQGALCNLKGRILSLWDIIACPDGFQLVGPHDLLAATQAGLNKTAMLSRVSLLPSTNYQIFGFYLQNNADIKPFDLILPNEAFQVISENNCHIYHLGRRRYVILVEKKSVNSLCDPFIYAGQWRGSLAWHTLQLKHQQFEIYPQSRGLFLPHDVGLQHSGYLSFNKGCYKGQEIIARMHYRAKIKHKLDFFVISTNEKLYSGQKILSPDRKIQYGELIDFSPIDNTNWKIVVSILLEHPDVVQLEQQESPVTLLHHTS